MIDAAVEYFGLWTLICMTVFGFVMMLAGMGLFERPRWLDRWKR